MQQQPPFRQPFIPQAPGPPFPVPPPPRQPTPWQMFRAAGMRTQWFVGCGVVTLIVLLSLCTCGSVGAALGPQRTATLVPTATTSSLTDTPTSDVQSPTPAPTQPTTQPTVDATATVSLNTAPTATTAPIETSVPTVAPTQPPVPTQAPVPTPVPTQAPAPTQPPQPTQPPPTGTNGNPWGFNFVPGNLIYSPPSAFCGQYFSCVSTFWTATRGYVVECANGLYSHSGGVRGACSRDGGPSAILYSH